MAQKNKTRIYTIPLHSQQKQPPKKRELGKRKENNRKKIKKNMEGNKINQPTNQKNKKKHKQKTTIKGEVEYVYAKLK